ncbi:MAG: PspC domain-containing protein [Acidimicrobiia bacterium]|nr:PspC domain-containing protein [Acidimicrobiia bacterium]
MQNDTQTAPEREASPDASSRHSLARPKERRFVAGVANGLADYWNLSPGVIQAGFIVLAFFGGLGFVLYGLGWLFIPNDDGTQSIAENAFRRAQEGESWIGLALIGLAVVILINSLTIIDGGITLALALLVVGYLMYREDGFELFGRGASADVPPPAPGETRAPADALARPEPAPRPPRVRRAPRPRSLLGRFAVGAAFLTIGIMAIVDMAGGTLAFHHYVGALLAVIAVALGVGAWYGRARWLIIPGLLLLPVAAISGLADINTDFPDMSRTETVFVDATSTGIYEFSTGDITLDLTELTTGPTFVAVDLGIGELTVILPADRHVEIVAKAGVGEIIGAAGQADGFDLERRATFDGEEPAITIEAQVGIGSLRVVTEGNG